MVTSPSIVRVAILDDYQQVALASADWSPLLGRAAIEVFSDHLVDKAALVERLQDFDVIVAMRERTPFPRSLLERLPKLRLIASTGPINAAIDAAAAAELGIEITNTRYTSEPTVEMTWALILAARRHVVEEVNAVRSGAWQTSIGDDLHGRTLGILGLGNIGTAVAKVGLAFGMRVVSWSKHLTPERAAEAGVEAVSRESLLGESDILTIHTLLSRRTRGLIDGPALSLMKSTAWLVNTSRGEIVDEAALLDALRDHRLGGYAVDVYDREPLPAEHPFRSTPNVLATPHLGYVTRRLYGMFYSDTVMNILRWMDGR